MAINQTYNRVLTQKGIKSLYIRAQASQLKQACVTCLMVQILACVMCVWLTLRSEVKYLHIMLMCVHNTPLFPQLGLVSLQQAKLALA